MTDDLPPGIVDTIAVGGRPGGMVRLELIKNRRPIGHIEVTPDKLGYFASALLIFAAQLAAQQVNPVNNDAELPFALVIPATTIGLVENPQLGMETVAFRVGEAQIGFAIPSAILRTVGESMITASAGGKPQ